jgi:hypothetical protein
MRKIAIAVAFVMCLGWPGTSSACPPVNLPVATIQAVPLSTCPAVAVPGVALQSAFVANQAVVFVPAVQVFSAQVVSAPLVASHVAAVPLVVRERSQSRRRGRLFGRQQVRSFSLERSISR